MWIIFAVSASLFWGIGYVLNEEIYKKISIYSYLAIASFAVGIATLLIAYFTNSIKPDFIAISSSKKLLLYVILGVVTLLLAELSIGSAIVAKNAVLSSLIELSYPVFIALFSYLLFKNQITYSTVLGGAIIIFGVFIIGYYNH